MAGSNITLNISLGDFVERQAREAGYGTSSEYVEALLKKCQDQVQLEADLLEGLASGTPIEADDCYWDQERARLLAQN